MTQSLAGKVALITGASSGIGEAMARAMAAAGCKLTLAARSLDKLNALADELDCATLAVGADMTQPAEIQTMVARTIEAFGTVDVLCANAGIYIPGDFGDGDMDALARLLTINVEAVMRCAHAVIPHMRAQANGDIVVTSSIAGFSDIHWEPVYSASKNAIQTFVHTLRRQLAGDGIRVMSLAPGQVANPLWGFYEAAEIERVSQGERTHLTSEDCADALLFMLSQPAHVTIRDLVILPQNQVNV
ncbi:MAG: SDR family oxidoreductase [Chloroflexi bacterium]|nr:SDR family oxidoreductase [Chloroflexota bacterium]MCY3716834.1 SDR family oxidoreductase [Chloroflexota bacterium]MDE2649680.1 SDR family oxidoreductase [Chloroflexota bacterium]MXX51145.1 SDR family oxidoreductase [Chloroflexota bacterium]MXX83566.1 SDR family oxidoreductase [Chloroflexota bacterium]